MREGNLSNFRVTERWGGIDGSGCGDWSWFRQALMKGIIVLIVVKSGCEERQEGM